MIGNRMPGAYCVEVETPRHWAVPHPWVSLSSRGSGAVASATVRFVRADPLKLQRLARTRFLRRITISNHRHDDVGVEVPWVGAVGVEKHRRRVHEVMNPVRNPIPWL